jgi:hypothetical protein
MRRADPSPEIDDNSTTRNELDVTGDGGEHRGSFARSADVWRIGQ